MTSDEWAMTYEQLRYSLNFDGKRLSGDSKQPATLPL